MSCSPCADAAVLHKTSDNTTLNTSLSTETHKDQGIDACSPFCVCTCCNTPTVMKQVNLHTNISLEITKQYADLNIRKVISAPISVWQPPRLG